MGRNPKSDDDDDDDNNINNNQTYHLYYQYEHGLYRGSTPAKEDIAALLVGYLEWNIFGGKYF